jgi:class 3 adenylate cyclase/HD superfamily phosphodiesterase/streptogramin lyase
LIRRVFESSDGTIWIGTENGLCRLVEEKSKLSFEIFEYIKGNAYSLRNNVVLSLAEDHNGFLWIGTFGGGLNRLDPRNNEILAYTEKDGLPNNVIYGILIDEKNNLWCSTNNGLSRFNAETKSVRNFDENDGLQSNEFNIGSYYKDESGELFFGGIKGINSFFASHIQINKLPPHLVITDFQLFNKSVKVGPKSVLKESVSVSDQIVLSYSQNVFSFSFSALHYSLPERNRYAYKLEGFDPNWIFDDNTRRAKYTNLDPGTYVFKVKGTNSDGIWSDEVHLNIIISPPFWRIWWIQVIASLLLAGGIFLFYRNRLKTIEDQKERLEKEVVQRTLEVSDQKEEIEKQKLLLEEEKEKLETLLLNVLPESTVEELKIKGRATARNYNKVTVMFTDFKGFTKISENLEPTELVSKLDSFFVKFDEIIEKYNVEKIKTIGDAYMCAGGIPIRNKSNPIDVVLAGLEIQREMTKFNEELKGKDESEWGLRLGIHTGNIIAGVIGIKRFAYDIWGDTVNVASRVETHGEVGMVNVSEATHEEIKDFFICEYRGKIHAKNKGEIDMFFVHSIKPHLSIDGKGIEPNDTFWEFVNLSLFSPIDYHKAEENIIKRLTKKLPDDLYYHTIKHTKDVTEAAERIALNEGVYNEDLYALKMAALYHDAGFIEKYQNNETIGARMAREDLPQYGFSEEQVNLIEKLVLVTFAAKKPQTILEKILRDADLDYLGREDFHEVSDKLKQELLDRNMIRSADHWDELQVHFLENHEYYTESARTERNELKAKHLEEIKSRMSKKKKNEVIN